MARYNDRAMREEWSEAEMRARDDYETIRMFQKNYEYTSNWLATHALDHPLRPNTEKQWNQARDYLLAAGVPLDNA